MNNSLENYENLLHDKDCKWCQRKNKKVSLANQPIQYYNHDGGYAVAGFKEKQWLYVECPKCDYQWALHKLGIGEITDEVESNG